MTNDHGPSQRAQSSGLFYYFRFCESNLHSFCCDVHGAIFYPFNCGCSNFILIFTYHKIIFSCWSDNIFVIIIINVVCVILNFKINMNVGQIFNF
jgi:hypothetical protein